MSSFSLLKGAGDQNQLGTHSLSLSLCFSLSLSLSLLPLPVLPPRSLSISMECWQEHNQNQQLQGTKLIFAKSELQPCVHPCAEAGDSWSERTIDSLQLQCF